jgi:hypothetical protein
MKVIDSVTGQRLSVDEAYDRFFDGFYTLGRPAEIFTGTMVLGRPKPEPVKTRRTRARHSGKPRPRIRHLSRRK